jgi:hypothetical protein
MQQHSMTCLAPTISAILGLPAPAQCEAEPIFPIVEALAGTERIAVVAPDALGYSILERWRAEMPYLDSLCREDCMLLRSVMPSITPVNFATMVSGVDKSVHQIGAFTDDFRCETLFELLRAEGYHSAGVGRRGYTGAELLARHADIPGVAENNTDAEVERIALRIAREYQPEFTIVQLGSTDDVFHKHGPSSPEVLPTLHETDQRLRRMVEALGREGYSVIITADHGQHDTETGGSHGTDCDDDCLVPLTWVGGAAEG